MLRPTRTFCDVPFCDDISASHNVDVAIIGAPHGTPYEPGVASHAANAPAAVREALGWFSVGPDQLDFDTGEPVFGGARVVDCGDTPGDLVDGDENRRQI